MANKKLLSIITTLLISTMVLGGCGASTPSTTASTPTPQKSDRLVIGFAQIGQESGWRDAETASIKLIPDQNPDVDLKFSDGQQKQENQIKAIRAFIQQKVDVIAVAPVVETGWDAVLTEAKNAKIPVIFVDRTAKVDDSLFTTFIGSDFITEGKNACIELAKAMGDKGNIVELQGTVGASAAVDRQKGFADELKNHPGMKIIKSQSGDFTRDKGKQVMEAFLKSDGKNIQGVYAHNDDMAVGAIQAIEESGLKPGVDIKVASIDGIKDEFVNMAAGKANVIVECNPLLGPQLVQAARDLKAGKTLERWIKSDEAVFAGADAATKALPSRKY